MSCRRGAQRIPFAPHVKVGAPNLLDALAREPSLAAKLRALAKGDDGITFEQVAEGEWRGLIVDTPSGSGGFGYDAHFWLPDLQQTAAQLSVAEKNRLSHRGQALRRLRSRL